MNAVRMLTQNYWLQLPIIFNQSKTLLKKILTPFITFEKYQIYCPHCLALTNIDYKTIENIFCYRCKNHAGNGQYLWVDQYDRVFHLGCLENRDYVRYI